MNEWKRPISTSVQRRLVGLDVVPPASGSRRSRQRSLAPPGANSMIVFYGDAQKISDGFALALNAMESNAHLLMMGSEPVPEGDRVRASERSAKRRK